MGILNDTKSKKKLSEVLVQHSQKLMFLSFVCGIIWFSLLSSDALNNKTYFSENALLPGLVIREFNPRSSLSRLLDSLTDEANSHSSSIPSAWILGQFRQLGLDVYQNNFTVYYPFGSKSIYTGNNLYAVLRSPKTSSTEALVISTPYRDSRSLNGNTFASLAVMIELAQAFRRYTYWSKDIIFLVTNLENIGFQAWLDAYHGVTTSDFIVSEKIKSFSGLIQGVINLEINSYKFSHIDIKIEGLHGQLPNLDLFNLVVELCNREQITPTFQNQLNFYSRKPMTFENWKPNFVTMSNMILLQATGLPSGGHGLFHRFGIQALTLKSVGDQKSTEHQANLIQLGRVIEGTIRSLNNLLERFHQSFFFYLLPSTWSYISIGLYILPFSFIALPVLIKALYLCIQIQSSVTEKEKFTSPGDINYWIAVDIFTFHLLFGVIILFCPIYVSYLKVYSSLSASDLLYYVQAILLVSWLILTYCLNCNHKVSTVEFSQKMCIILLALGGFMFTLALVNISFALIFTMLYVPIAVTISYRGIFSFIQYFYMLVVNPFVFTYLIVLVQSFTVGLDVEWWNHLLISFSGHKKLILYTVEDMYFFGNWNYKICCLIILPVWYNLLSLKTLKVQ